MRLEGEYKWLFAKAADEIEGYYYLIDDSYPDNINAHMYEVSESDKIYYTQGLKMPTNIDQMYEYNGEVFTYQQPIYITVEIQAMQSKHLKDVGEDITVRNLMPVFKESFSND